MKNQLINPWNNFVNDFKKKQHWWSTNQFVHSIRREREGEFKRKFRKRKSATKKRNGLLHHIDFAIKRLMFKFFSLLCMSVCVCEFAVCKTFGTMNTYNSYHTFDGIDYTIKFSTKSNSFERKLLYKRNTERKFQHKFAFLI